MNTAIVAMPIPRPADESTALIQMIERAARDPAVDIDKLTRLMAMRKEAESDARKTEFARAMALAQSEMRPVAADASNPQTRSKFASYHALDKAVRHIYAEHGFALSFDTADGAADGSIRVVCYLLHTAGHSHTYTIDMPADGKGARGGEVMSRTHATGSAVTYGKRYLLGMIFNIVVGASDDDGNAAGGYRNAASNTMRKVDADKYMATMLADMHKQKTVDALVLWMGANGRSLQENLSESYLDDFKIKYLELKKDLSAGEKVKTSGLSAAIQGLKSTGIVKPIPDPVNDLPAFLAWLDDKCGFCTTEDALSTFWNDKIDPLIEPLFPPDASQAIAVYNRHMERISPPEDEQA